MLFVDYRDGSKELVEPLRKTGLPVEVVALNSADIYFEGRGLKGKPVTIGIEYKKMSDLISSLRTERLQGHQLPKMRNEDQYDFCYLFIEGELLFDKAGRLLRRAGRRETRPLAGSMGVGELLKRLFVLHISGGLNVCWYQTEREAVKAIECLYHVWTDQDQDQHKSHLGIYVAPSLVPLSNFRIAVSQWPGVGRQVSLAAEKRFSGNLKAAVNAPVKIWADLVTVDKKGRQRKFGMKAADELQRFFKVGE